MTTVQERITYTDEQIDEEIRRIRAQVDMMETLLMINEENYYHNQHHFVIASQANHAISAPVTLKGKIVRKLYRIAKAVMDKTGLSASFKKTNLYHRLAEKGCIFRIATGRM